MKAIKPVILYIVLVFATLNFAQSSNEVSFNSEKNQKRSLISILEKIRVESGVNFIYSNIVVKNILVNFSYPENFNKEEFNRLLSENGLACKYFGKGNIVIYKSKETPKKNYGQVVIKNIVENDTGDIKEPQIISDIVPVYPALAVINKIEGMVRVKLLITRDGNVSRTVMESSSGSELLDAAAIDYARKLKFIPAQVNGKFQNIWLSMLFNYYIKNK